MVHISLQLLFERVQFLSSIIKVNRKQKKDTNHQQKDRIWEGR